MTNISGRDRSVNRSCDLEAANARLFQLRQQLAESKSHTRQEPSPYRVQPTTPASDQPAEPTTTPGPWLKPLYDRLEELHNNLSQPSPDSVEENRKDDFLLPSRESILRESATLRVYPSILAGILKQELAAAGRVWLLARYLDPSGQGWITVANLRKALTNRGSALRICGWRRLRQILQQGNEILWEQDRFGRIWLYSNRTIAIKLELERLTGKTVYLPIKDLIGTIATTKAVFYASFHAGRSSAPISRATLNSITGVSERSQRTYDELAGVKVQTNICIGELFKERDAKDAAYEDGSAHFIFKDHQGKFGPKGQKYHARQLPNSYTSTYHAVRSSQQKKINQALKADLVTQEALGYGHQSGNLFQRSFFLNAKKASRAKRSDETIFLFDKQEGGASIWYKL